MKVCFEIYLCALEEGIIKEGERILCIAGNVRGANTVMLFEYKSLFHICMGDLPNFKIIFSPFVILTSDKLYWKRKKKPPLHNEQERMKMISSLRFVDKVILSPSEDEPKEFAELISKIHPDIIALGYDLFPQRSEIDELYKRGCYPILVRIPAYKESKLKTSKIKKLLDI
jgi:glycerol-3-phosphate cytidylyltransferase-like family protein